MRTTRFIELACVFFYVLCWLTDQPTKALWYVGVALPWLSVFASVPITFLGHVEENDSWKIWAYVYTLGTLLYIMAVMFFGGEYLHVVPHLLCCIAMILLIGNLHTAKR